MSYGGVKATSKKSSSASVRIFSDTLTVEEICTSLGGLEASRTHRKGERRGPQQHVAWKDSLWLLKSPLSSERDLPKHLEWLLDVLEPNLSALQSLSSKCKIDIFCGFSSESGQGGFVLDSGVLARLAKLQLPLIFDLYPPGLDEHGVEA